MADAGGNVRAAVLLGQRLRAVRLQQEMSLHDVDARSRGRFKASVVGAYERGERAMSLDRLVALAAFYRVPLTELVPGPQTRARHGGGAAGLVVDLTALDRETPQSVTVGRFVSAVQAERRDYNGRVLTIRGNDVAALAAALDTTVEGLRDHLAVAGIAHPPTR